MHQLPFVVNEKAYCVCEWDLPERNLRFLASIDPDYFRYLAEVHGHGMDNEDKKVLQHASVALRTAYSQGLETLFAFIFATVQAPQCVAGWLLKYKVSDITDLLEKIKDRKPIKSLLEPERLTWEYIASVIFSSTDKDLAEKLTKMYSELWQSLASDYLREDFDTEYNNIKHGFRVSPGGFSFAMGTQEELGVPAKEMVVIGESKYGSTFFVPKKIGSSNTHFRIKYMSRNWEVGRFIVGLHLISLMNQFYRMHPAISRLQMDTIVEETNIRIISPEDILKVYDKSSPTS